MPRPSGYIRTNPFTQQPRTTPRSQGTRGEQVIPYLEPSSFNDGSRYEPYGESQYSTGETNESEENAPPKFPEWKVIYNVFPNKWQALVTKWQAEYDFWLLQNQREYDTPKSQVERYGEAGLSTALMYGQGTPGQSGKPQAAPGTGAQGPGALNMLSQIIDSTKQISQIKNIKANTFKTLKDAGVSGYRGRGMKADIEAKDTPRYDASGPGQDIINRMSPRERKEWEGMQLAISKANRAVWEASTAELKNKAQAHLNILLEKQVNWYTTNQIAGLVGTAAGVAIPALKLGTGSGRTHF